MIQPLTWTHRAADIAEGGLQQTRAMTAAEREAFAQALDILSCDDVRAAYKIRALGEGRYRLSGDVSARLKQQCVVTLEPIEQELDESFDVEFWPANTLPATTDAEVEVLTAAEIEPIEHGLIDAGRIVFEILSAGLDPYPRKPNAAFAWKDDNGSEPARTGPFAGLSKLKDKR